MFPDPADQDIGKEVEFGFCQGAAWRDPVPFLQTGSAADPGCMLRNKAGVSLHGRLFPIIFRVSRSEPLYEDGAAMILDILHPVFRQDLQFFSAEAETGSEF